MQIRYLRSMAREMPDGKDRLRARIALAFAALSLPAPASALRSATRNLAEELDRQILPDGGHISRNPMAVLELLADLLPLRQTYANQAEAPPAALIGAIERMLPALRFFRHQDGSLARFNGMGATIQDRIAAILRHDDTAGAPLLHAPHSGYERLSMGGTTVIADTGPPPPLDVSGARACRLPFLRAVVRPPALHRQCRRRHLRRRRIPAAGARHRRPFDRDDQRHVVGALQPLGQASTACLARRWSAARAHVPCERHRRRRHAKASSRAMTAMSPASASSTSAN